MKTTWKLALVCLGGLISVLPAQEPAKAKPPEVNGAWTGTWSVHVADPAKAPAKALDCTVVRTGDTWQATFEGECGRPYKYTIKMDGRQAGGVVLFKGTCDLGPKDGGVFDWIGRANDKEFIGFYTSGTYTGTFKMARKKDNAEKK